MYKAAVTVDGCTFGSVVYIQVFMIYKVTVDGCTFGSVVYIQVSMIYKYIVSYSDILVTK